MTARWSSCRCSAWQMQQVRLMPAAPADLQAHARHTLCLLTLLPCKQDVTLNRRCSLCPPSTAKTTPVSCIHCCGCAFKLLHVHVQGGC